MIARRYLMFARTQQEAGLHHAEWEERLAPQRSWLQLAAMALLSSSGLFILVLLTATEGWF